MPAIPTIARVEVFLSDDELLALIANTRRRLNIELVRHAAVSAIDAETGRHGVRPSQDLTNALHHLHFALNIAAGERSLSPRSA